MKNQFKTEYEASHSIPLFGFPIYTDWLIDLMQKDVKQFSQMTKDNRKSFTNAFGKPHFTWINGDGKKDLCWKWNLKGNEIVLYIFTGERGTSYEVSYDLKSYPVNESTGQYMVDYDTISGLLIDFMKSTIFFACKR